MKYILGALLLGICAFQLHAQQDSLVLKNHDALMGEIKSLSKGVLIMETPYSDDDFHIKWGEVLALYPTQSFLIIMSNGDRYSGTVSSSNETPGKVQIYDVDSGMREYDLMDVVYLKSYESKLWNRFTASIDLDYSYTKANNYNQIGARAQLGYLAPKWSADVSYGMVSSTQDDVDRTKRVDGNASVRWFLQRAWYLAMNATFLSNTEQKLQLRSNLKPGVGKFLIRTNSTYLGCEGGLSYVYENFSSDDPDRSSWEGYLGAELNLYDIGDLSLLTRGVIYPGISESGRFRADYILDVKYDLPLDIYVKFGITANYDNQVVAGASEWDYIIQTGVGWELDR